MTRFMWCRPGSHNLPMTRGSAELTTPAKEQEAGDERADHRGLRHKRIDLITILRQIRYPRLLAEDRGECWVGPIKIDAYSVDHARQLPGAGDVDEDRPAGIFIDGLRFIRRRSGPACEIRAKEPCVVSRIEAGRKTHHVCPP